MNPATLGRSLPDSARRRWRKLGPRSRTLVAALTVGVLGVAWVATLGPSDPWPARAVLRTPRDTWPLAFSPDGRTILTFGQGGITPWDVATGRRGEPWALKDGQFAVAGAYSPDGRTFAAAVAAHPELISIDLIDTDTGRVRATLPTRYPSLYHLAFMADGQTVRAFLGNGPQLKEVVTWEAETGREASSRPLTAPTRGGITAVSPDGQTLAIASQLAAPVKLWDLANDRTLGDLANPASISPCSWGGVGFSEDGRTLAIGRQDGTIELWDLATRRILKSLRGHSGGYASSRLRFSPDSRTLASTGNQSQATSALGQIQDSFWYALGSSQRKSSEVVILDIATGERLARAGTSIHPFYSPDGRTVATREPDLSVKLRDIPAR